jgi:dihydroorotate dehydrogenase electron transfer subunit
LIGDGAGIGRVVSFAEQMRDQPPERPWKPLALLGSAGPFPFRPRPSTFVVPGVPPGVIACMPLLEEWSVASRLASTSDLPGCFDGAVTALADAWLGSLAAPELAEVEIFACGSAALLEAAGELARRYGVPCQMRSEVVHDTYGTPE